MTEIDKPDDHAMVHPESLTGKEMRRLFALWQLSTLDTAPEARFDDLTKLVSKSLNVPTALISLVDLNRQWFKSCFGLDATETPRSVAFCSRALQEPEVLIVPDATLDERFKDNGLVIGPPYVRAYAGAVIRSLEGHPLGTVCVVDYKPRSFTENDIDILKTCARLAERELIAGGPTARQRNKAALLAYVDPLTGFEQEKSFTAHLAGLVDAAPAADGWQIVAVEIGNPEDIADRHGGAILQLVALETAARLASIFPAQSHAVGRSDDDLFLIGMPAAEARRTLSEIMAALKQPFPLEDETLEPPMRIGIVRFDPAERSVPQAIELSREAVELAREYDPDGISVHELSKAEADAAIERMGIAAALPGAVETGEVSVAFALDEKSERLTIVPRRLADLTGRIDPKVLYRAAAGERALMVLLATLLDQALLRLSTAVEAFPPSVSLHLPVDRHSAVAPEFHDAVREICAFRRFDVENLVLDVSLGAAVASPPMAVTVSSEHAVVPAATILTDDQLATWLQERCGSTC